MTTLVDFISQYDTDNTVKKAISNCICGNIAKSVAIDVLALDLQKRLYQYIWSNDDLLIDNGSNVERDFRQEIIDILTEYFNDDVGYVYATNKEDGQKILESPCLINGYIKEDQTVAEKYQKKKQYKNCSTCKNNVEFPPPHTCDVCTSLDQEEEYEMWEAK